MATWPLTLSLIGPGEMIRTSDPYNPIVVRYQTALRPEICGLVMVEAPSPTSFLFRISPVIDGKLDPIKEREY